jgi:hypothetical protein
MGEQHSAWDCTALPHLVRSGRLRWPCGRSRNQCERESAAIEPVVIEIEEIDHFGFAAQRFEPSIPHILGRARRA